MLQISILNFHYDLEEAFKRFDYATGNNPKKLDSELLSLLLNDKDAKETFFTEVNKVAVFDKVKFQKFISNKQFLPDSYTAFKNKIGLTANGEYITEANEVVLDFPYKDCVLEGGQTGGGNGDRTRRSGGDGVD